MRCTEAGRLLQRSRALSHLLQSPPVRQYLCYDDSARAADVFPRKNKGLVDQLQGAMGPFKEYQLIKTDGQLAYFKSVFEKSTVTMLVGLTPDNKLSTFRFAAYKADSVKSNIVLNTATGNIYGTVSMPVTDKKVPVVLIIAGSGPTDRDGNQIGLSTDTYKQFADSLMKHKIACLRYDKRGVGESASAAKKEDSMRFNDYIGDAVGFIKMLKQDARFSKVIVAGHSEGSLIGMVAASQEHADGYISIAGAGFGIDKVLEEQYSALSPGLGHMAAKALDSVRRGYTAHVSDPTLSLVLHTSIQPFLLSWIQYDPQKEIKKLKQPVLILQGTNDIQVAVKNAEALHRAAPKAKFAMLEGINHVLKQAPADREKNIATYNEPALPISGELVTQTVSFVNNMQ
jgi:pimeloyl-ACP methyl ester carboxylesterase